MYRSAPPAHRGRLAEALAVMMLGDAAASIEPALAGHPAHSYQDSAETGRLRPARGIIIGLGLSGLLWMLLVLPFL
ncbi:MAG TPA: hypothetical protein VGM87_05885 [Roseomonas sp.]